ncbi:MAG: hypothetical protein QOJ51_2791, partial [Acidobacteriaceae bacterium]|nr:hypothetical protein [Acidobacteriaceae bacterium]
MESVPKGLMTVLRFMYGLKRLRENYRDENP